MLDAGGNGIIEAIDIEVRTQVSLTFAQPGYEFPGCRIQITLGYRVLHTHCHLSL